MESCYNERMSLTPTSLWLTLTEQLNQISVLLPGLVEQRSSNIFPLGFKKARPLTRSSHVFKRFLPLLARFGFSGALAQTCPWLWKTAWLPWICSSKINLRRRRSGSGAGKPPAAHTHSHRAWRVCSQRAFSSWENKAARPLPAWKDASPLLHHAQMGSSDGDLEETKLIIYQIF